MRCIPIGKGPRECFMCVAFDTWVKRLTQTCSVPPDIKREETNTKGSNIKSFRLWTIGHRTFYGYVLFLASICFQIQLPVSYRYLKGLSPRSSERDAVSRPRRRHQEKELLCQAKQLDCFLENSSKSCLWYTKSNPSVYQHMSASECITALLLHAYQTARLAVTFLLFFTYLNILVGHIMGYGVFFHLKTLLTLLL